MESPANPGRFRQLGGIASFLSGRPLSHTVNVDRQNSGGQVRGNWVSNPNLPGDPRTIDRWFNTDFAVPTPAGVGQIGNAGRNLITGPGVKNFGFLLSRSFFMPWENHFLRFRLESFNFTNTPAFGNPNTSLGTANAGRITSAGEPRRIQFALKCVFQSEQRNRMNLLTKSTALLGFLFLLAPPVAEQSQQATRPNILFAIADDWAYGHAGAYGNRYVKTPAFDRVAREGVLFTHAFTPNAKCAPSRAIILTGRNSWQLEEAANHIPYFPAKFKTWVEALRDNGYFTGLTAKGWAPGVANDANGKARQMAGKPFNARKLQAPTTGIDNNDYAANFDDFLNAAPKDQPWSFWYGALEPHRAYEYGSGVAKGGKRLSDIDRVPGFWPDNETVRNDMLDYALEIEHFDQHLARMLATLEKRGLLDNTIVIVTSDHGMPFPRAKGQAYDISNHVPLAVMWKAGLNAVGRTVSDYISFADFAPTLIELAGLRWNQTGLQPAIGRSLTDILFSAKSGQVNPQRDHVLVGKERHDIGRPNDVGYPIRGIHKNDWLYVRNYQIDRWPAGNPETGYLNCDGGATKTVILQARRDGTEKRHWQLAFGKRPTEELYDVKHDPDCLNNLANDPKYKTQKAKLRTQMERELKTQGDPRMFGKGDIFDKYEYANPEQLHFYERFMRGEKLKAGWVSETDFEKEPIKP